MYHVVSRRGKKRKPAISGALCIYNCTFCPAAADGGSIRRKQVQRGEGDHSVGAGHFIILFARIEREKKKGGRRIKEEDIRTKDIRNEHN